MGSGVKQQTLAVSSPSAAPQQAGFILRSSCTVLHRIRDFTITPLSSCTPGFPPAGCVGCASHISRKAMSPMACATGNCCVRLTGCRCSTVHASVSRAAGDPQCLGASGFISRGSAGSAISHSGSLLPTAGDFFWLVVVLEREGARQGTGYSGVSGKPDQPRQD